MREIIARLFGRRGERAQSLPMLILMVFVVVLFVGLGLDAGFAYLTRAALSKSVDAACISGVRNLFQGQAQAIQVARSTFAINYNNSGVAGRDVATPNVNVAFTTDASNNLFMDVDASVQIRTFFVRLLPSWQTMTVQAHGQAIRPKLILGLVLDRSGSMNFNGGATALPPAVSDFIDFFDDSLDRAGMVSFASHSVTNSVFPSSFVAMAHNFKTPIKNAADAMHFEGGTGSPIGLTNGFAQIQTVSVLSGEEVVKVCVFFTDGLANIVQDTLNCGGSPTLWNFGGYDNTTTVGFFNPASGTQLCTTSGGTPSCCAGVNRFTSQIDGTQKSFVRANVTAESEFRSVQIANAMRANGIIVYAIGLGNNINQDFLKEVANDPTVPGYVRTDYDGEAVFAPSSAQLQQVFADIASKILLRLTR